MSAVESPSEFIVSALSAEIGRKLVLSRYFIHVYYAHQKVNVMSLTFEVWYPVTVEKPIVFHRG